MRRDNVSQGRYLQWLVVERPLEQRLWTVVTGAREIDLHKD